MQLIAQFDAMQSDASTKLLSCSVVAQFASGACLVQKSVPQSPDHESFSKHFQFALLFAWIEGS